MSSIVSLHITVPTYLEADKIARGLVEQKLVACANIIKGVKSIYRWEGKIEESDEILLILKTKSQLSEEVRKFVKSLHSDLCPCILEVPITGGYEPYLNWVISETKS